MVKLLGTCVKNNLTRNFDYLFDNFVPDNFDYSEKN